MDALMIRNAVLEDSPALAILSEQLGYPTTAAKVKARLGRYLGSDERRLIVAEIEANVIAWLSIEVIDHFYIEKFAEISGFVVDQAYRNKGIGHALMAEAQRWTTERGLTVLRLKTNILRTEAHHFYESMGFERTKTQYTYVKKLASDSGMR